ncbi:MAG TPA: type VII secretion-associated serine protease mycosin [Micromonosporaceae bacterium]
MTTRRSRVVQACLALTLGVGTALAPAQPAHADRIRDLQWHLEFLNVAAAHRISQGDDVTVAVIDTGVDARHPDLAGAVLPGVDLVGDRGNGHTDLSGHGTAMAGLIAARGRGNGRGVLGIAPRAMVFPVRDRRLSIAYDRISAGIEWAISQGADVICIASTGRPSAELQTAIAAAIRADIIVVAAVGNRPESSNVGWPAAYPGVVAAAGVDRNGNHAEVSVTGPEVILAAPAVEIVSTDAVGGTGYSRGTGTSGATAIIAGAAALVRARFPDLSAAEVVHRLTATAIDKGPPGRDEQYGYGVIDLVAALTADVPPMPTPSASPESTSPPAVALPPLFEPQEPRPRTGGIFLVVGITLLAVAVTGVVLSARAKRQG